MSDFPAGSGDWQQIGINDTDTCIRGGATLFVLQYLGENQFSFLRTRTKIQILFRIRNDPEVFGDFEKKSVKQLWLEQKSFFSKCTFIFGQASRRQLQAVLKFGNWYCLVSLATTEAALK